MNLPVAGFIDACARSRNAHPLLVLWCAAEPSGKVTADAFDTITGMIVDRIAALGDVDAVYLDLHGAMVTDAFDDGDLEIIRRVCRSVSMCFNTLYLYKVPQVDEVLIKSELYP